MNYGAYMPQSYPYYSYTPMPQTGTGITAPDPFERRNIKKHLSSSFIYAIIHAVGATVLALTIMSFLTLGGYESAKNADGKTVIDWVMELAGTLPSIIMCFVLFFVDKTSNNLKLSRYLDTSKMNGGFMASAVLLTMFFYSVGIFAELLIFGGFSLIDITPIGSMSDMETELTPLYLVTSVLTGVFLAPVAEELMFRGILLRRFSKVSQTFGIVLSAMCFGMMHGNLPQGVMTFLVGLVFAYMDIKAGSILPSILLHMLINLTATSSDFVQFFTDEETSEMYFLIVMILYCFIGLLSFLVLLFGKKIKLPDYTEYHKKRSWRITVTCISFWIMITIYLIDIILAFEPIAGT